MGVWEGGLYLGFGELGILARYEGEGLVSWYCQASWLVIPTLLTLSAAKQHFYTCITHFDMVEPSSH